MLEFLVAVSEPGFRFDNAGLLESARRAWPDARVTVPTGRLGDLVDAYVDLPSPGAQAPQLSFKKGGEAFGLDAPTRQEAAAVLAWLASSAPIPADGSVVVIHWADDLVPLRPGMTEDELLAVPED